MQRPKPISPAPNPIISYLSLLAMAGVLFYSGYWVWASFCSPVPVPPEVPALKMRYTALITAPIAQTEDGGLHDGIGIVTTGATDFTRLSWGSVASATDYAIHDTASGNIGTMTAARPVAFLTAGTVDVVPLPSKPLDAAMCHKRVDHATPGYIQFCI